MKALRKTTRYRPVVIWKPNVPRPKGYEAFEDDDRPEEYADDSAYAREADAVSAAKDHWLKRKEFAGTIEKVIIRKEVTRYETTQEVSL